MMGLQARLMSQALRKLTAIVNKSKCIIVFINQIRMKIGVMFGNPETTTGGNALKFYSSVRLEIRRIESIDGKGEEDAVGNRVRVKVVKNKVAPPFRKVEPGILAETKKSARERKMQSTSLIKIRNMQNRLRLRFVRKFFLDRF